MDHIHCDTYDFIIIGAGASGCTIASQLAKNLKHSTVLLIEAGGQNNVESWRIDGERWLTRMNPEQAWGYQTVPQQHLGGRVLGYDRGKGLGGSTAINFSVWNIGPRDDHDEIARLVDDDEWRWENAQKRYKRLENYNGADPAIQRTYNPYLNPKTEDHGDDGPIKVGFPVVAEKSLASQMDIWKASGYEFNPDANSGNPLGLGLTVNSAQQGLRSTAADMLTDSPSNLHILTDTQIARVLLNGTKAVGVETLNGQNIYASKEIVLSAGALDTPKLLMLSGVGPEDQLAKFAIPLVHDNPHIGQHLRDHFHVTPTFRRTEHSKSRREYYASEALQKAARIQWETNHTGPLSEIACASGIGFFKSEAVGTSAELEALPKAQRGHLQRPTVPSYEVVLNGPSAEYFMDPQNSPTLTSIFVVVMNTQSEGSVALQSADPHTPLLYDPAFLSHPFDRRVAIEATREMMRVVDGPKFRTDHIGIVSAPASDNEGDILEYWEKNLSSTWHMCGTCKMGQVEGQDGACVDKEFKVFGTKGLRVADMSVVPILPK